MYEFVFRMNIGFRFFFGSNLIPLQPYLNFDLDLCSSTSLANGILSLIGEEREAEVGVE